LVPPSVDASNAYNEMVCSPHVQTMLSSWKSEKIVVQLEYSENKYTIINYEHELNSVRYG
jgi:phage portal protein BeeE